MITVEKIGKRLGRAIGSQDAGRFWHSDLSYKKEPSMLSALYALEVPEKNGRTLGETRFASTTAAYEASPEDERQRLSALRNVRSYRYPSRRLMYRTTVRGGVPV